MTENPNETLCSTQFYNQIKRELINSPCTNDVTLGFYSGNVDPATSQLTDSNLKYNVHIVLENLKRSAEKTYLHDNANNNNSNSIINSISNISIKNHQHRNSSNNIVSNQNYTRNSNQSHFKNVNTYSLSGKMSSPESDCNSNVHANPLQQLASSIASSHDFTHDNSDYQWFLDYNYRENNVTHQSVLSSLSASYNGIGELSYYDDLAKNIDANLAGVDMESFRAEDINLLLSTIPNMCKTNAKKQQEKELDNSIFKSKQLFSPVKESILSVDSLDMDCYAEDCDMIITCQANKNNYTIAFEGSTMYSDESFYTDANKDLLKKMKHDEHEITTTIDDIVKKKALEVSLCRSESGFTTWSKLKKDSSTQLHRYPSGNNNTSVNVGIRHCVVRKSSSLPNLQIDHEILAKENFRCDALSNSTIDSFGKQRVLLPMCQIVDSTSQSDSPQPLHASSSSNEPQPNQPSFNLVKLFIKQKSSSTDTCMDVSSGCWPSDSSSSVENRQRKKSMYDSGKGSALSKHDEDTHEAEIQYDSLDLPQQPTNKSANDCINSPKRNPAQSNDLYREVFDSPSHRKYKEFNLNIRNQHLANVNNNNSMDRDSLRETIKSISDASRTSDNITQVYAKTKLPLDMITKSMQTSRIDEGIKVVPPSFLAQLNHNNKSNVQQQQAPVYVIYPNYALPDLGFVKNYQSQIVLSPLGLKETLTVKKQRPLSTNDIEYIKKKDYNHIIDWKSLAPLLPFEYKRILQHIPEVENVMNDPKMSQKPLFCMSPPIRRSRPMSCDCSSFCTDSSTGSSQPPSSGYRGSSTMLTDSEIDALSTNSGNNNRIVDEHAELPPSGYMRRGILRRANSSSKSKRNSMTDETATTPSSIAIRNRLDKRCSVQDPYYAPASDAFNPQYYPYGGEMFDMNLLKTTIKSEKTKEQLNIEHKEYDDEARSRVEQFLSSVPKSELKYYAEIANILESLDNISDIYDRNKLKNEVSRALAQKHVSFDRDSGQYLAVNNDARNARVMTGRGFTTPPNSPNISISAARGNIEQQQKIAKKSKQEKIQSNRFKRLQIQWELLSKDAQQMERELFKETQSGGNTPTATTQNMTPRSRIPRPVSYPASKPSTSSAAKSSPSPSRIATPKKMNIAPSTTPVSRPRTPSKLYNTPKKTSSMTKVGTRVK